MNERKWLLVVLVMVSGFKGWSGGLFLSPTESIQSTWNGQTAVFNVLVVNSTSGGQEVTLVVDNICPGWSAIVSPSTLWMSSQGISNVTLTVSPPSGWNDACTVDVQAWDTNSMLNATAHLTLAQQYAPQYTMTFSASGPGQPLAATNSQTNVIARLEWAHELGGPWHRSWQGRELINLDPGMVHTTQVPRFYRLAKDTISPGMVLVDEGPFVMGFDNLNADQRPVHPVALSAFYMDRYEVTIALWHEVRGWANANGYTDLTNGLMDVARYNHPVTEITWYDAIKWCNARSEREGLTPVYYLTRDMYVGNVYRVGEENLSNWQVNWHANGYRLPTEAEWEKAARGGLAQHTYPWWSPDYSASPIDTDANFINSAKPYEFTTPVGFYNGGQYGPGDLFASVEVEDRANGYGLYDVAGNVSEWCWDWYVSDYYDYSPSRNPHGPQNGTQRVHRGGSYGSSIPGWYLRCDYRTQALPGEDGPIGLRCVRSVEVLP